MSNDPKNTTADPKSDTDSPQNDLAEPSTLPANTGIDIPEKANLPDADRTVKGTLPTMSEQAAKATGDDNLVQEHHTGRDHSEPTDVTETTNDNAIDSEFIDIGGGD